MPQAISSKIPGQSRTVIENVYPQLDEGLFPIKRVPHDKIKVSADIFGDGHDHVNAAVQYKFDGEKNWHESRLLHTGNDRWEGEFEVSKVGFYSYRVVSWLDTCETWLDGFHKKAKAGEHLELEIRIGLELLREMHKTHRGDVRQHIQNYIDVLENRDKYNDAVILILSEEFKSFIFSHPIRQFESISKEYRVMVEIEKAQFSTWYEFFPRSSSPDPSRSGTFNDCKRLMPMISHMGFDVVYFPPIHPIGVAFRKGKNNSTTAQPGEPGSPWAIGSALGGHKDVNPELGTMQEFEELVAVAKENGIDIALDLAYQCSPEHPYVKEHPQWFKWRPDGTVQYAENPPKKYQDVLPIYFENPDWQNLWLELKSIVQFWIDKGIRIFRVDNPHTKPYHFWQWLMAEFKREAPDVIFLSEAFTRPKVTARLSKVGFQQAYTYFVWRQTKAELTEYMTQLTQTEWREHFRPNFWPNTPDILPYYLQNTGFSHSAVRFVLAATLSSNYGLYGPVYEMLENTPVPGKEEYLNSEKYEVRHWDWESRTKFRELMAKVNHIRKRHKAFHSTYNIQFLEIGNENLIAYLKLTPDHKSMVLVVVNLDPEHTQSGFLQFPLLQFGLREGTPIYLHDLMNNAHYTWQREWNYIELNPSLQVAHIFEVHFDH